MIVFIPKRRPGACTRSDEDSFKPLLEESGNSLRSHCDPSFRVEGLFGHSYRQFGVRDAGRGSFGRGVITERAAVQQTYMA
jgi:hypothetical protein